MMSGLCVAACRNSQVLHPYAVCPLAHRGCRRSLFIRIPVMALSWRLSIQSRRLPLMKFSLHSAPPFDSGSGMLSHLTQQLERSWLRSES